MATSSYVSRRDSTGSPGSERRTLTSHPLGKQFQALHPWHDPMQRLIKAALLNHILATPMAGQSILYGTDGFGAYWREKTPITKNP
ncbi:MAG: hypothetical protein KAQ72_11545 [Desulfobacula sp.]|nr:hypothetical protein [Desulfobacula sp.]